jgi:hypothetical protein
MRGTPASHPHSAKGSMETDSPRGMDNESAGPRPQGLRACSPASRAQCCASMSEIMAISAYFRGCIVEELWVAEYSNHHSPKP